MTLKIDNYKPKFIEDSLPKIGLIALSTDYTIEKDFNKICFDLPMKLFVNRLPFENPMSQKNYLKMSNHLENIAKNILPGEKINTIAYGCTSGTIAIGEENIVKNIQLAKPNCYVTTPITAAVKAIKKLKLKKMAVFAPYPKEVNQTVINYLTNEEIEITSFGSYNLDSDLDVGKVDSINLKQTILEMDTENADAVFVSCTALPILEIIEQIENKIQKPVLSSNQVLIWDSLRSIHIENNINNYGKLFKKF